MPAAADMYHARQLWNYLRLGVPVHPAECLLVFGGHDLGVAGRTAELYEAGIAPFIVVSGRPTPARTSGCPLNCCATSA
jgi:hypothetical protein